MNSADLLREFGDATLASSVAVVFAFLLSRWLRARFGAGVAYAAWWLVPAALVAVLLPAPVAEVPVAVMPVASQPAVASAVITPITPFDPAPWLAALWLLGALAMAAYLWRAQCRFERGLGHLRPLSDELWKAQTSLGLPALLGVLRARIVLPDDFQLRYDARERQLMLAHERTHRRRGDHLANFAVAVLRCVFWFNPLVHLAARSFRHDQELACDQAVIAAHPDSRRAYGEAMLKTLMADRQAPLGCHWGFSHPLKERVMQLKSPMPRPWARRIGATTVALLALGTGFAVWSAQPARPAPHAAATPSTVVSATAAPSTAASAASVEKYDLYSIVFDVKSDEQPPSRIHAGGPFDSPLEIKYRDGRDNEIFIGGHIRRQGADRFDVALELQRNGVLLAKPRLILARDEPGAVKIDKTGIDGRFQGIELSMRVDDRGTPPHLQRMLNALPAATVAPSAPVTSPRPRAAPARLAAATPRAAPSPLALPSPPAPVDAVAPEAPPSPVARPARLQPVPASAPPATPTPPSPPAAAPTPMPALAARPAAAPERAVHALPATAAAPRAQPAPPAMPAAATPAPRAQ